ncbi:MAG: phage major tail tube protein [Roseiarcus sp.]|jgi:P2 family phage contractile tail tube protein
MAQNQLDFILQSFSINIDGFGMAGSGEKCTLPKIKKHMEKYRGGGMVAPRQHALGYDEFEFECSLSAVNPQVIAQSAFLVSTGVAFSVRAFLDGDNNTTHSLYMYMRGEVIENDFGEWEAGKKAMMKIKIALDALNLTIDGASIFDIDIENGVDTWNGTDVAAMISGAIGS